MGVPPTENGPIGAGADHGAVVGTDLDAGDAATVAQPYVGHYAIWVVPHLHQLVISTWDEMRNTEQTNKHLEHIRVI